MTEWRPIPAWPEYEASDDGRVRRASRGNNWPAGKILKPQPTQNDYLNVHLYRAGQCHSRAVNRLVCSAFHGAAPTPDHEAAHWNGVRSDNRPDNLRWATPLENAEDRNRHGTTARGERGGKAKLTQVDVVSIRSRAGSVPQYALAAEFGVAQQTIEKIVNRKTWRHI